MKRFFKWILHYNAMLLVVLLIFLPGLLAIYLAFVGEKYMFTWVKSHYCLYGFTVPAASFPKTFQFRHITSHTIQKAVEQKISNTLPMKSWMIRISNQFYFSVFKTSYAYHNNIIIGKNDFLFESPYIKKYCKQDKNPVDLKKLTVWADQLKELSLYFKKRNKTFIYLITPNKAEMMYDAIPDRYHCSGYHENRGLKQLQKLLIEKNIPFVNAAELLANTSNQYTIPFFPKGGTHWNDLGGIIAANALIQEINHLGYIHVRPIEFSYRITHHPKSTDDDLISLMNLMRPNKHYIVPELILNPPMATHNAIRANFIGDSFIEKINSLLNRTNTFSCMHSYRYFKLKEYDYEFGKNVSQHNVNSDFSKVIDDILNADVIVLEENSSHYAASYGALFYELMKKYAFDKTG